MVWWCLRLRACTPADSLKDAMADQLSEFMNSWLHEAFMSFVRGQFALSEISRSPG